VNALIQTNAGGDESLSLAEIGRALAPYIPKPLSDEQLATIGTYVALLKKWNQIVPLTSIKDDADVVARHFGESLFAASLLPMDRGRLADVGSGGGFPGLPLKIAFRELQTTLIETNVKKCAFLKEIRAALDLSGVEIVRKRYEDFGATPSSFGFVCCRALGGYKRLLQWSRGVLKPDGHVVLWLGIEDANLLCRTKNWRWSLPVSIPESRRRVILTGKPLA
jgi:16S rRNA (guanine527-N7)-methyltransferase